MPSSSDGCGDRFGWMPLNELRNKVLLGRPPWPVAFENVPRSPAGRHHAGRGASPGPGRHRGADLPATRGRCCGPSTRSLAQTVRDQVVIVVDDGGGLFPDFPDDPRLYVSAWPATSTCPGSPATSASAHPVVVRGVPGRRQRLAPAPPGDRAGPAGRARRAGHRPDAVYTAMRRILPDGISATSSRCPSTGRPPGNATSWTRTPSSRGAAGPALQPVAPRHRGGAPEDWEMIYRFSRRHRVEHIPEPTVDYTINPESYWTAWEMT